MFAAALAIAAATGAVAALAAGRTYLTFGTETDLLGTFVPAAERVGPADRSCSPFTRRYIPPCLRSSAASSATGSTAGLVISVLAFAVGLGAAYALFRLIGLASAAWGALLALATSPLYLHFGAQATSDVFFFSLYALALLLVGGAWRARYPGRLVRSRAS